jgi:predicted phage baseplate assembly protein
VDRLDPAFGYVYFGDGIEGGKRPPAGMRIRAASYMHGGGSGANVGAGIIKELSGGSARLTVRHEWPCRGGVDAETVDQAERRIPQFLTHRNRAVTKDDFKVLAENNPVNPVARAEVAEGFMPGATIQAARENVPGVVSVFVLPPREAPALRQTPRPTQGLLKDVFAYLLDRVLIGTELYVLSPEFVPMAVGVRIDALDRETEQQTLRDAQAAVVEFLWPLAPGGAQGQGWPMGGRVKAAELVTQVARVAGVRSVNAVSLFQFANNSWRRLGAGEAIELKRYQLPELLGVSVGTGAGEGEFPGGLAGETTGDNRGVPTPFIPEVC